MAVLEASGVVLDMSLRVVINRRNQYRANFKATGIMHRLMLFACVVEKFFFFFHPPLALSNLLADGCRRLECRHRHVVLL